MSQHLGDRAGAYVDGVLAAAEAARAADHLRTCGTCRARVAEQQRVRDLLRGADGPPPQPPAALLAALAAMPDSGVPARPGGGLRRPVGAVGLVRRSAVCGVALGATVLASAWVAGAPAVSAGPPAVSPSRLLAQHAVTAGELPFWGAGPAATTVAAASVPATKQSGTRHPAASPIGPGAWGRLDRWVTHAPDVTLRRAAIASATVSYRGVEQVTSSDGAASVLQVAEVAHVSGEGTATRPLRAGPSSASFQPAAEGRMATALDAVGILERTYRVRAEGVDTVAGRRVDRLAVYDRHGELAGRFWIDRASGLPLARENLSGGRSTGTRRLTAVTLVEPGLPTHLPVATSGVWDEAVPLPAVQALGVLQGEGWVCPAGLATGTGLQAFDALVTDADAAGSKGQVLHLIYTDGLRSVSVFQQRAALDQARLDGFAVSEVDGWPVFVRGSVPREITWASAGMVFTVMGDVPAEVLDAMVAALPHTAPDHRSRTVRGLARVGSWIDPFG